MTTASLPESGGTAWRDVSTRRAVARYGVRHLGLLAAGLVLLFVGSLTTNDDGDAKAGISFAVPFVLILLGIMTAVLGALGLFNGLRMTWVLRRRPWLLVQAQFDEIRMGTPNGQPVLHLSNSEHQWTLTLAALNWRWARFSASPTLLLAGRPGRGGVVATADRRSLAWAGRSVATACLLWRRRRRQ